MLAFIAVAIGGIVEIAPLFWIDNTIEKVEGMRPYTPLEQAGRDIYVREGCYACHSQMIRPFRDEVERYGHYSLAAESMYDHPFQWGSKRTGPDLARVGGRYSDEWHVQHLNDPRSVVPESDHAAVRLPCRNAISTIATCAANLSALRRVGVPYTKRDIDQGRCGSRGCRPIPRPMRERLRRSAIPRRRCAISTAIPTRLTEMDALVAYLQMLGTLVDVNSAAAQEELAQEKGR